MQVGDDKLTIDFHAPKVEKEKERKGAKKRSHYPEGVTLTHKCYPPMYTHLQIGP